jgi:penicillin-binding protein 1C
LLLFFLIATQNQLTQAAIFDPRKSEFRPSESLVLDRNGEIIQRLRTDNRVRGTMGRAGKTSPAPRTALMLSEDRRFY